MKGFPYFGVLAWLFLMALGCSAGDSGPDAAAEVTDTGLAPGPDVPRAVSDDVSPQDTAPEDVAAPIAWCEGATTHLYDPVGGAELWMFPDDFFTREDPASPTGLRLEMTLENAPWLESMADLLKTTLTQLGALSGFATQGGVFMRFSAPLGPLPSGVVESVASDGLLLLDLDVDPPERIPFEAHYNDEDTAFILWPLRPLRPKTRHAVIVTTSLLAVDGGCIQPSAATRALLGDSAVEPALERSRTRYQQALAAADLIPEAISAVTVFTTHGDLDLVRTAHTDAGSHPYAWEAGADCTDHSKWRRCERSFVANDYRGAEGFVDASTPTATYTLPVSIWLPKDTPGPYPVVVVGHGINHHRGGGAAVANYLAPLGIAVIATDALQHGDHPTAIDGNPDDDAIRFLGMDFEAFTLNALAMRGNFDQTALDRLQLLELMATDPDVDGDGIPDLDPGRIGYFGISLGGLMGSPLLALSDDIDAAVLTVAGGRLISFAIDNGQFEPFKPFVVGLVGSEALFDRMVAVLQSVVDAADPATYGPYVLSQRFSGAPSVPHVLFNVAANDETVPPATGRALARALGLPHVAPVVDVVDGLSEVPAPVVGNLPGGETAGFFQFDRVSSGDGVVAASHNNVPFGAEGLAQEVHFLKTWLTDGTPEILDPYAALGTPPL